MPGKRRTLRLLSPRPTSRFPRNGSPNGHQLIGYWAGYGGAGSTIPLRELSPQWDVIIVAFSTPDRNAPEGTMQFRTPAGLDTEQFKADIAWLKKPGQEGHDFTRRRRPALHARRSETRSELRLVRHSHRHASMASTGSISTSKARPSRSIPATRISDIRPRRRS